MRSTTIFVPTVPTCAVRETTFLGIMGAPRVPPLNPSESIVLWEHYRLWGVDHYGPESGLLNSNNFTGSNSVPKEVAFVKTSHCNGSKLSRLLTRYYGKSISRYPSQNYCGKVSIFCHCNHYSINKYVLFSHDIFQYNHLN